MIDYQLGEPLRPIFLLQLLLRQVVSNLGRHLELRDEEGYEVVGANLFDERVGRVVRVSRLGLPRGSTVFHQRGEARVLEVLQLLLRQRHRTILVTQAAEANTTTS